MKEMVRAAVVGAAALLALHLASFAAVLPAWRELAPVARAAVLGIGPRLLAFHAGLSLAVAAAGAALGIASWAALRGLALGTSRLRVGAATIFAAGALVLRTVARKPALFEAMLARQGGWRAWLEVLVAERIGVAALDRALLAALTALAVAIAVRQRGAFRRRAVLASLGAAVCAILVFALWPHPRARTHGTSVVVLAADSLRPDHFSSEGYPRPTTPNLDALRTRSAWVADEFVPIASTTPSWTSMLTGVYPDRHGVRDLFPRAEVARVRLPLLPRLLAARGFRSAVVSDYAGETFQRVGLGFDLVDTPPATSIEIFAEREAFQRLPLALGLFAGAAGQRLFPVAGYLTTNADPAALTDRALERLGQLERGGRPFLLVVFYSVTHAPFAAPMPDAHAFFDPAYAGPSRYSYEIQQISDISRLGQRPADAEVEQVRALYDGALRAFDREVGRVVARLERDGLRDRVLCVTGDHGENLFEQGVTTEHGKWFEGGEAANRTVLLLEGTGIVPGRIEGMASGVDFMPTVLDALHLPAPPGLDGIPLLRGIPGDRTVFAESAQWLGGKDDSPPGALWYPPILDLLEIEEGSHALVIKERWVERTITAKLRAARKDRWELVYTPTEGDPLWKLIDLARDPFGQHDLSAERPEVLAPLQRELEEFLRRDRLRWLDAQDRVVARLEQ